MEKMKKLWKKYDSGTMGILWVFKSHHPPFLLRGLRWHWICPLRLVRHTGEWIFVVWNSLRLRTRNLELPFCRHALCRELTDLICTRWAVFVRLVFWRGDMNSTWSGKAMINPTIAGCSSKVLLENVPALLTAYD